MHKFSPLLIILSVIFALEAKAALLLNSSPVTQGRHVILSLSTQIPGPYSFSCLRDSGKSLTQYNLPIPDTKQKENTPYSVFYGNFEETEVVECIVKGGNETEKVSTLVQVVPASQIPFRFRREFRDLSDTQRRDFFEAVVQLKKLFVFDYMVWVHGESTRTPARNPGEENCTIPECTNRNRDAAHGGPAFLPWHREYIHIYEDCLRMVAPGKDVASHFWNWIRDSENGRKSPMFTTSYFGSPNNTKLENGEQSEIIDGYFVVDQFPLRESPAENYNTSIMRTLGSSGNLPNYNNLRVVLCSDDDYDIYPWQTNTPNSWRDVIEGFTNTAGGFHNIVHNWVGGTMGPPPYSSNDPIFYAHHSFIDGVFLQWQLRNPEKFYLPLEDDETAPQLHKPFSPFVPFGNTADGVWEAKTFEYDMKDFSSIECNLDGLYPKK